MNPDLPLDQVRTLLAVAEAGTFDAAAEALHVTPSAVSQRVKAVEQRTGRVLLIRTKPVRLTESGEAVVRFGRQLTRMQDDVRAELGMSGAGEPHRVPIAVNADSLSTWFVPALRDVPEEICFELHRADESATTALLREGRVMAAVTSTAEPVQGCAVRRLGSMRYLPCAAPSLVERYPDAKRLITEGPVLYYDDEDRLQEAFARRVARGRTVASGFRHRIPSSEGFVTAVVGGLGWGMVPRVQAEPLLAEGALVEVYPGRSMDVPLHWQQWKLDSPVLAAAAEAVTAAAAEGLE